MNTPDDIDDLLTPRGASADPRLRDRLREQTARLVRPQFRLVRTAAVLAACYLAGVGTWALVRPIPAPVIVEVMREQPTAPPAEPERSPQQLELAAEQADGPVSAALYLAAARKFARERGDWAAALRCYRNALDVHPDLTLDPQNDDWLMTALKLSRREATAHANEND